MILWFMTQWQFLNRPGNNAFFFTASTVVYQCLRSRPCPKTKSSISRAAHCFRIRPSKKQTFFKSNQVGGPRPRSFMFNRSASLCLPFKARKLGKLERITQAVLVLKVYKCSRLYQLLSVPAGFIRGVFTEQDKRRVFLRTERQWVTFRFVR